MRHGAEVGRYHETIDWPKLGPSFLIATCLVVANRTAKWPAKVDVTDGSGHIIESVNDVVNSKILDHRR